MGLRGSSRLKKELVLFSGKDTFNSCGPKHIKSNNKWSVVLHEPTDAKHTNGPLGSLSE